MHLATHALVSWLIAESAPPDRHDRRARLAITLAGIAPDLDGLGAPVEFLSKGALPWFSTYHHAVLHNGLTCLVVAVLAWAWCRRDWRVGVMALIAIHVHLLCDLVGSRGPDGHAWPIPYLAPSDAWTWQWGGQWALNAWPNIAITLAALLGIAWLGTRRGRTPVELLHRGLDGRVVAQLRTWSVGRTDAARPASDATVQPPDRWARWMGAAAADLRVVACLLAAAAAARIFSVWWQRGSIDPHTTLGTIFQGAVSGLRLDMRVSIALIAFSLALTALRLLPTEPAWAERLRRNWRTGILLALCLLTPLATAIDLAYLGEYGHRFDATLFAAGADDPAAILKTIWLEWPVARILAICLPLGAALAWLAWKASRPHRETSWWLVRFGWKARIAITCALFMVVVGLARGSLTRQDWNMRIAATGLDPAVDRMIPSPWKALHRGWLDHRRMQRQNGVEWFLPDGDVRLAAQRVWGEADDLDQATARTARGGRPPAPRHVMLAVLESYGSWPLDPAWRDLGLADGMARLGHEGQLLTRCISSGDQTMKSFGSIITGLPYAGVELPDLASARTPYPSSLPATFKRLGYRTRLFYAGYASWQQIADFMYDQGFDEVVCGGPLGLDPAVHNAWGLPDAAFLPAVLGRLDDATPTLTVVLTVGNHSPFDADVRGAGWTMTDPPPSVASRCDDAFNATELGHFWLMDREFERFARQAEAKLPGLLLAATGDHYGRRFPNHRPDLASRTLVPLLLWGPGLDRAFPAGQAGGHFDLATTLIERCAPTGFAYHAFGRDLLSVTGIGVGQTVVVSADTVAGLKGYGDEVQGPGDAAAMRQRAADLTALGWWRAMQGPAWPSPGPSSR